MKTITQALAKTCYALFGTVFLAVGASVLLVNSGLLPDAFRSAVVAFSQGDLNTLHIIQELGSTLVLAGLMTFWFLRHYEQSRPFHWAMTAFWGLIALVHWVDVRGPFTSVLDPLVNSVPFLLFVVLGLLRMATEGARGRAAGAAVRQDDASPKSPSRHERVPSQAFP